MINSKTKKKTEITKTFMVDKSMNSNLLICENENEMGKSISNVTLSILCNF